MTKVLSSYRLWILVSGVAVMLLVLWSKLYDERGKFSGTTYEHSLPKRRPSKGGNAPPILAYWILGSEGENRRILRLLKAIYHPRNRYLLQLGWASTAEERIELAVSTHSESLFREFGNVDVVGESYGVNPMGASGLAAMLHAAALLLRVNTDWDWFIPLTTLDYPILNQDDILYAFSFLPRDVIFMVYNNGTSLEKSQNVSQIAVDPSLYLTETQKSPVFYAAETREKPDAFQIFGGSPWMVLTRDFLEHCVNGLDNLPRKLLMYFNNVVFPLQSYFQTVLCNTPEFQNTTLVNHNLRRTAQNTTINVWDSDPLMAIFARPFKEDNPMLQDIDEKLLNRDPDGVVPGKWRALKNESSAPSSNGGGGLNSSSVWGDIDAVQPGAEGIKVQELFSRAVEERELVRRQCQNHVMLTKK